MKERPILFSAPMVRAIMAGTKTQTRRVVKPQPERSGDGVLMWGASHRGMRFGVEGMDVPPGVLVRCPYGQPGDRLWVRETFYAWGRWETRYNQKKGRDEWHFVDLTATSGRKYRYAAEGDGLIPMPGRREVAGVIPGWWKRPAIFMPHRASRITLEISGVRVERLQDINAADALAEGVNVHPDHHSKPATSIYSPVQAFRDLWESINGPDSWDVNPWVWAIEFRRLA